MMNKNNTFDQLKQSKLTAFYVRSGDNAGCSGSRRTVKRKNNEEVSEAHLGPIKRVSKSECKSPDLFPKSSGRISDENSPGKKSKNEFENLLFDDFENDFLLSPKKKESPKKNILRENFSLNETWPEEASEISFTTPVKCKVVKGTFVFGKCYEQVLLLISYNSNKKGICKLRDVWTSFSFSTDDVVSVQATLCEGHWVIDNKNGFIILQPDILVSSTALARSMYCLRQGILSNFFKEMDSENNVRMFIGRLIHELFQECLKNEARSEEELIKIMAEILQSRNNLHDIFFSGVDILDIEKEVKNFIPSLKNFLHIYVDKKLEPTGKNFRGAIESVLDIEEVIKSPVLGFQGRVDVTVRLKKAEKAEKIAPLELKTGRASFSQEHRSQLILYILLMNEIGREVDSGLLLYLRENICEEIVPARDDVRNLFLLRNHFVGFYKSMKTYILPEPIRNVKSCVKCPYMKICTSYLKGKECDKVAESHPLRSIENPDIKPSHVDYFLKWIHMLWLEFEVGEEKTNDNEILKVTLQSDAERFSDKFKYNFLKTVDTNNRALRPGCYVEILDGKDNVICSGQVVDTTDVGISILADKQLNNFSDTYKLVIFKSNFLNVYFNNLGWLLKEEFETLRCLIIDKEMPRFDKKFDKTDFQEKCIKHLMYLNKEQQKAVLKALMCQDYLLVKGPPGTGKTQTIVTLIKVLLALNQNVLIASHTNSSVDNILLRIEGIEYLRLGSLKSIHEDIRKNSYSVLKENCSSIEDIKKLFERKLIASTCLGIDVNLVRRIKIDFCILDESSQILQPEALRALFCCKKFILVGDEDQLPPVVRNPEARKLGMSESIFEWLASDQATVALRLQYRMNSVINSLANAITYQGLIECANEKVAKGTMKVTNVEEYSRTDEWVAEVLSKDLEKSVVFVDTSECFRLKNNNFFESHPRCSFLEANIIVTLINSLLNLGLKKNEIGVIAPFWDQIALLKKKLAEKNLSEIEINTVDQYQGRDKEVILFSCTKENKLGGEATELELLSDKRRLTVAVTRAKHKLIIIGDKETVMKYVPFQKLITSLNESQFFRLSDGQKGFFWEKLLK